MKLQKFDGYTFIDGGVCAAQGFLANGIQCGLAHKALSEDAPSPTAGKKKNDLAVIYAENPCAAAAVYTTNTVKGAPILVTREPRKNGTAQAAVENSPNSSFFKTPPTNPVESEITKQITRKSATSPRI